MVGTSGLLLHLACAWGMPILEIRLLEVKNRCLISTARWLSDKLSEGSHNQMYLWVALKWGFINKPMWLNLNPVSSTKMFAVAAVVDLQYHSYVQNQIFQLSRALVFNRIKYEWYRICSFTGCCQFCGTWMALIALNSKLSTVYWSTLQDEGQNAWCCTELTCKCFGVLAACLKSCLSKFGASLFH